MVIIITFIKKVFPEVQDAKNTTSYSGNESVCSPKRGLLEIGISIKPQHTYVGARTHSSFLAIETHMDMHGHRIVSI